MGNIPISKVQMRKLKTNLTKLQNLTLQKKYCFDKGNGFYSKRNIEHKKVLDTLLNMFYIEEE